MTPDQTTDEIVERLKDSTEMRVMNFQYVTTPAELHSIACSLEQHSRVNINWFQTVVSFINKSSVELVDAYNREPAVESLPLPGPAAAIPRKQSPNKRDDISIIRHNPMTPTERAEGEYEILPDCGCIKCADARPNPHDGGLGLPLSATRMVVCPICGNRRCPRAAYHGWACTHSNEPGQVGRKFGAPAPPTAPTEPGMSDMELIGTPDSWQQSLKPEHRKKGQPMPPERLATVESLIGEVFRQGRIACYVGLREFAEQIEMNPSRISEIQTSGLATAEEWMDIAANMRIARERRQAWLMERLKETPAPPTAAAETKEVVCHWCKVPLIREEAGYYTGCEHCPPQPAPAETAEESAIEYLSGWPMTTAQIAKDFIAQADELTALRARVQELESTLESFKGAAKSLKVFGRICCRANELAATHTQPQTPAEAERSRIAES